MSAIEKSPPAVTRKLSVEYRSDGGPARHRIGLTALDSDVAMAELDPEAIFEAGLETCLPEADALFISCTAIRAVQVLERLERALDKPVISSIQTMFWQCLRESGYDKPVQGFGYLLRM